MYYNGELMTAWINIPSTTPVLFGISDTALHLSLLGKKREEDRRDINDEDGIKKVSKDHLT